MEEYETILLQLKERADPSIAKQTERFFKTSQGQYAHGDLFLGLPVPVLRKKAKACQDLPLSEIKHLLYNQYHEIRLLSLFILVLKFSKSTQTEKEKIYLFYLENIKKINNWDLVDSSAYFIIGPWLQDKPRKILFSLADSQLLWSRRIAIISTFHFIKNNDFSDTLKLSALFLNDPEDLIHKAVGWMLREIGKRDQTELKYFLSTHYKNMPRTMLRYSIEKFPEDIRKAYLKGNI